MSSFLFTFLPIFLGVLSMLVLKHARLSRSKVLILIPDSGPVFNEAQPQQPHAADAASAHVHDTKHEKNLLHDLLIANGIYVANARSLERIAFEKLGIVDAHSLPSAERALSKRRLARVTLLCPQPYFPYALSYFNYLLAYALDYKLDVAYA